MTTTVSQEAHVTQADREAAVRFLKSADLITLDRYEQSLAQAFARHRQQAERGEAVAWMYERKPDAWPSAPPVVTIIRWPEDHPALPFWNEFALYTLPTPPEAV